MSFQVILTVILLSVFGEPGEGLNVLELMPSLPAGGDWEWADDPEAFGPDTLFEYLNGGAPQYLSYGFLRLGHARYALQGDDLKSVTLDVFDMGSQLGAFGIYSSGRPREFTGRRWGTEGYRSGVVGAAWHGRVYVHAAADEESWQLIEMLERLISQVTADLPWEPDWPDELALLPEKGLLPNTTRFVGKDLLGHSFLPGGFLANYRLGSSQGLLFLTILGSPDEASIAFDSLRSFEREKGVVIGSCEMGEVCFQAEDPGLGPGAVFRRGSFVAGLWGMREAPQALAMLMKLDQKLLLGGKATE